MYRTGFFAGVSLAVMAGVVTYFSGTSISGAADVDATKVYMTHCKTCHGENGHPTDLGTGLGAREFANAEWQAKTTDEQIIKQINNGTPEKMMPFKEKLTQDEIKALVSVIRSFGKK
ncbi:MAG: cytochrome C [Candidatus Brocadia sp. WS118]|nr:MAG: cytochrome C [Candidatus Brocadia sp. WS118]